MTTNELIHHARRVLTQFEIGNRFAAMDIEGVLDDLYAAYARPDTSPKTADLIKVEIDAIETVIDEIKNSEEDAVDVLAELADMEANAQTSSPTWKRTPRRARTEMHEPLTEAQWSILNCCGYGAIRDAIETGDLPRDHVEVNSRIAQRCLWENRSLWQFGRWFHATWNRSAGGARSGRVCVQRAVLPDESVRYYVVAPQGRWHDSLTEEQAKKYLVTQRNGGRLMYLTPDEEKQASYDYSYSCSR